MSSHALNNPQSPDDAHTSGAKHHTPGHGSACTMCRLRKVRCDGARPICSACAASHRECAYVVKRKVPSPVSAATLTVKLAGLQERYAELLSRISASPTHDLGPGINDGENCLTSLSTAPTDADLQASSSLTFQGEISELDRDTILKVFFREKSRAMFYENQEDFFRALKHPCKTQQPLPALVDVMVLLGCFFIGLPTRQTHDTAALLERLPPLEFLIARIHSNISDSLALFDRLKDAFCATSLLCQWLFYQGRFQEAQYLSSSMARVIIGAKLHRIDRTLLGGISNPTLAANSPTLWDNTLLGRPRDLREVGSRILVFWQAFIGEKLISMVTGLPSAYDDSGEARITTVFPRSLEEYESGAAFQDHDTDSMRELFSASDASGSLGHENRYRDTMFAMLAQAMAIADYTCRLTAEIQATPEISRSPGAQETLLKLQASVSHMAARTPLIATHDKPRPTVADEFEDNAFVKANLVSHVWLVLHVSEIQICRSLEIHYAFSEGTNPCSTDHPTFYHNLAVEKARKAAEIVRSVLRQMPGAETGGASSDMSSCHITGDPISLPTGFYLAPAAITLAGELRKLEEQLGAQTEPHDAVLHARFNDVESDFTTIRQFLESISQQYPILDFQLTKLDNARMGLST